MLPRILQAGYHSLPDYAAFQLGHGSDDGEHGLSHWRAGVQRFLVGHKVDA
jgi:hypothetical protein